MDSPIVSLETRSSQIPTDPVEGAQSDSRFLSQSECNALAKRIRGYATGGGATYIGLESRWTGNLRWGDNRVSSSGDTRDINIMLRRNIRGAGVMLFTNDTAAAALRALMRRAEQLILLDDEQVESGQVQLPPDVYLKPKIWSDATYDITPRDRAAAMRTAIKSAQAANVISAGYLEVSASGNADYGTNNIELYYPSTKVQLSVTMRDALGTASGWAGVDHWDWTRINPQRIVETALEKCLSARNPEMIEPGRYTVILEPQAVCDFFDPLMSRPIMDRATAESPLGMGPFTNRDGTSKIGLQMLDERISVVSDPMDPDLGYVPFDYSGQAYHPAVWFDKGVLTNLAYDRHYGIRKLGVNTGLLNSGSYRMSGGSVSIPDMIASTRAGLLITRFSNVSLIDANSLLVSGYTRDGVWLIQAGKISRPVRNFRFSESILFAFNNIMQIGHSVRVFHPDAPVIVPAIKIRDFNFVGIADAL